MHFASPLWLLLALPVAALAVLWWLRSRRPDGLRFSNFAAVERAQVRPRVGPDEVLGALVVLGLLAAVTALARPQQGLTTEEYTGSGVDIILCLDTSGSMRSVDFQPQNRLGAAKEVARTFIQGRPHDRIGLVVFGGAAVTSSPLTVDKAALLRFLDLVSIDMTGVDGTAIGMALALAADRLRTSAAKSRIIVLLTDGRNNQGAIDPLTAARAAGALGIKIYAVGAASPEGGLMPVQDHEDLAAQLQNAGPGPDLRHAHGARARRGAGRDHAAGRGGGQPGRLLPRQGHARPGGELPPGGCTGEERVPGDRVHPLPRPVSGLAVRGPAPAPARGGAGGDRF